MESYKPGISVTAGTLMMKWDQLNQHIRNNLLKLNPGDKVNVFINLEGVLRNLSFQKNLNSLISFHKQQLVIELESSILNLVAHYRMYMEKEKCIPSIYLYYTDINTTKQQMEVYNKDYRSYYHNRYMQNPQFRLMGDILHNIIIPEVKLILCYVNNCYLIESKTFDSSIIPYIISTFSDNKNVIISSDIFDTLYLYDPNFITIYMKRRFSHCTVASDIDSVVQSIVKNESPFDLTIFNSEMYFRLLLAIKGSKIRNIASAKGFGYGRFMKILKKGIEDGVVLRDFSSLDSIIQLFPEQYMDSIKTSFQCTSIDTQYSLLNETDIDQVKSQIVDKVDIESLNALNNKRFLDFPINLQGLCN